MSELVTVPEFTLRGAMLAIEYRLLGTRLAATPAADKADWRCALSNTGNVRIVVVCQLVAQA